jgi:hypothetical protein
MTFSEYISYLLKRGQVVQLNVTVGHFFPDEVNIYLDVLGLSMKRRIRC